MEVLRFRRAIVDDVPEIVALVNSCYRGDSSRLGWTTEADLLDGTRTDDEEIRSLITQPGSIIVLCLSGEEIIGSVHIQKQGDSSHLGMFVVNPGLQGGGVGRRLMEAAELTAREEWGSAKMAMSVITMRAELIAYYERRGYARTGQVKPFVFDETHGIAKVEGIELEVLEKELSGS